MEWRLAHRCFMHEFSPMSLRHSIGGTLIKRVFSIYIMVEHILSQGPRPLLKEHVMGNISAIPRSRVRNPKACHQSHVSSPERRSQTEQSRDWPEKEPSHKYRGMYEASAAARPWLWTLNFLNHCVSKAIWQQCLPSLTVLKIADLRPWHL